MKNSSPQALILAGGLGTRLRSVVKDIPKPMAPLDDTPFLHYLLTYLRGQGIDESILLTGYRSEIIEEYFGDGAAVGMKLTYCREKELLGTAGALRNALPLIHADSVVVLNGDTFFPCDLRMLIDFHRTRQAEATIALKLLAETTRYGRVETSADYGVTAFREKTECIGEGYINGGIYIVEKSVLANIESGRKVSLEREVFPSLDALYGLPMGDRFIDIGIPEDYARAREQVPVELRTPRRPAIFLDRDGVINHDGKYVHRIEDIEFCPAIFDFCLKAQKRGYLLVVVTNQAGIARGYYGVEVVECLHEWMKEQFAKRGITLTDIIMCPYHEKGTVPEYSRPSLYRKPEPGMILEAVDRWHIDLSRSIMIGDKRSDRIRLPYLTSYVLKSDYVEAGGWDFESLDDLRRTILTTPTNSQ